MMEIWVKFWDGNSQVSTPSVQRSANQVWRRVTIGLNGTAWLLEMACYSKISQREIVLVLLSSLWSLRSYALKSCVSCMTVPCQGILVRRKQSLEFCSISIGLREDIKNWIRQCDTCEAIKIPPVRPRAPLGTMLVGAPLDRLGTDFLGLLPLTSRGNCFILVVTDYFTKWVEIFVVPDQTAVTTAEVILNEVIARFGCPYEIHSDQGRNYESTIFTELCRFLEVRKTRTSPGNPKCNGQTERFNKTLVRMIKAYLKGQDREWDRNLGCLAAAYRSSQHESTGVSPNLLMLGREVRIPAEIMFGSGTSHVGETVVVMQNCYPTPPRRNKNDVLLHGVGRHFYFGGVK